MKTLISNGTVVNATGTATADVLIDGETIAAVLAPGSTLLGFDLAANVDRVIDASGKYVIPGGIDAHTHMEMPFGGTFASDTFESGTTAAAWGGTTTIVDFVVQYPHENPVDVGRQVEAQQRGAGGEDGGDGLAVDQDVCGSGAGRVDDRAVRDEGLHRCSSVVPVLRRSRGPCFGGQGLAMLVYESGRRSR